MNNIEKRLQAKVKREEASKQREYEKMLKRIEVGTKKIYYVILKHVIKNKKEENVYIYFNEFVDVGKSLSFLECIHIHGKVIFLGKTYFNFDKLQIYLNAYGFNIKRVNRSTYSNHHLTSVEKRFYYQNSQPGTVDISGVRSQVCHKLLTLSPQNQQASPSPNTGGPTLTKK